MVPEVIFKHLYFVSSFYALIKVDLFKTSTSISTYRDLVRVITQSPST